MKFRYLGKNESMSAFGHDFSGDATPDVTDETAIKKLAGNSHFEAIREPRRQKPAEPAEE